MLQANDISIDTYVKYLLPLLCLDPPKKVDEATAVVVESDNSTDDNSDSDSDDSD